ncbi:MAG: hypothetical protein Q7T03_11085 [Deltaproteobacteria bacterium]|nr:hypothetical protein [Deltaproteobacteria bacterium]
MIPITQTTNLFLGVTPDVYRNAMDAGLALALAPTTALGAELGPLANAYGSQASTENERFDARNFRELLDTYKEELVNPDPNALEFARMSQMTMARILHGTSKKLWKQIVRCLEKYSWATQGGFLATPPLLKIEPRLQREARLLLESDCEENGFHSRWTLHAPLGTWLRLPKEQGTVSVPTEPMVNNMKEAYFSSLHLLTDIQEDLKSEEPSLGKRFEGLMMDFGFTRDEERLKKPTDILSLSDASIQAMTDFLEGLVKKNLLGADYAEYYIWHIRNAAEMAVQYQEMKGLTNIDVTLSLWDRNADISKVFNLPASAVDDLSLQVWVGTFPNGTPVSAYAARLVQEANEDPFNPEFYMSVSVIPLRRANPFWTFRENTQVLCDLHYIWQNIAAQIGIPSEHLLILPGSEMQSWTTGLVPLTMPLDGQSVVAQVRQLWFHPHSHLFHPYDASYEAMRHTGKSRMALQTPLVKTEGLNLTVLQDLFLRTIDPAPDWYRFNEYAFGFSGGTGRSVDFMIEEQGRWNHLNGIGVGRTFRARLGRAEVRDGLSGYDEALNRFYLSNLLHDIAGPLGFRTSLVLGIVDHQQIREGHTRLSGAPQHQATIWELRREQLRMDDLRTAPHPEKLIEHAKEKLMRELGLDTMTVQNYVEWAAKTLAEQFAIMTFLRFDHGMGDGSTQLHDGNGSLAMEICDLETGRFIKDRGIVHNRYWQDNDLSIETTRAREKAFRRGKKDRNWVSVLLEMVPEVQFANIMTEMYWAKRRELEKSGIDPQEMIRKFNENKWKPFIRESRQPNGAKK